MQFDIVKLGKGTKEGTFRYAEPFSGKDAQELVREAKGRIVSVFNNAQGLQGHLEYNPESEMIEGSSTNLGILLNSILAEKGKGLPTIREGIDLDKAGRLSNGVYRDWGVAVYSEGNPNANVAKVLMERGYQLPFLASFNDLRLRNANNAQGLEIFFVDEPKELIQGEEAEAFLRENNFYTNKTGARGVDRDWSGIRGADWNNFDDSNSDGRVDFVCAEGAREKLQARLNDQIDKEFNQKEATLKEQFAQLETDKTNAISSSYSWFQ